MNYFLKKTNFGIVTAENLRTFNKPAFTLAEVLITLMIIGVVAALTIPALINKTNDEELKSAFKKTFSDISNASSMIKNENGGSLASLDGCNSADRNVRNLCFMNYYAKYMGLSKICPSAGGGATMSAGCWTGSYKYLGGGSAAWLGAYGIGAMTNGGYSFSMYYDYWDCSGTVGTAISNLCATMMIDVNGNKQPNRMGKDLFSVYVTADGIKPAGIPGDGWTNTCKSSTNGTGCAADALYN